VFARRLQRSFDRWHVRSCVETAARAGYPKTVSPANGPSAFEKANEVFMLGRSAEQIRKITYAKLPRKRKRRQPLK
jgi:hypothetical protein